MLARSLCRLPAVLLVVAAAGTAGTGCGRGVHSATTTAAATDDAGQVRDVVTRFGAASAARDDTTICRVLLAPALVRSIERIGLRCEDVLARGLGSVKDPRLTVGAIQVRGARASAAVHSTATGQPPSDDVIELVRVGGRWHIASLGGSDRR